MIRNVREKIGRYGVREGESNDRNQEIGSEHFKNVSIKDQPS